MCRLSSWDAAQIAENGITMVEEIEQDTTDRRTRTSLTGEKAKPTKIADVVPKKEPRVKTKLEELNRVLGGGVVTGIHGLDRW